MERQWLFLASGGVFLVANSNCGSMSFLQTASRSGDEVLAYRRVSFVNEFYSTQELSMVKTPAAVGEPELFEFLGRDERQVSA